MRSSLAYITDVADQPGGGGSYAVNWHIQRELRKHFDLLALGPIVPRVSQGDRFVSRVQRYVLKRPSKFFYFSPAVLESNAARAAQQFGGAVDAVLFRSATRWCHCRPEVPYFVYLDIVFHTFFENTFHQKDFIVEDLQRIYTAETKFLENAAVVFFESDWGLQKARAAYGLTGNHYQVAGRGGVIEPPERDERVGEQPYLLSIAMNFEQKGGDIILQAFRQLKEEHPDLLWHVVGGAPTGEWRSIEGIIHEGLLDASDPVDLERYRTLLADAFLLLHPTREDTNPLVITEAGYFGCPAISVNRFALPELVIDGETGILLDFPAQAADLATAVARLMESPTEYRAMRRAAFHHAHRSGNWELIGQQMADHIVTALA